MKLFPTVIFITILVQPALLYKTAWHSSSSQSCLTSGSPHVVDLTADGASSSVSLSLVKEGSSYLSGSHCSFLINAPSNHSLLLTFERIDTRPCYQDNVTVETRTLCGEYKCPSSNCPDTTFSDIPSVEVFFQSSPDDGPKEVHQSGFQGTVTAYTYVDPKSHSCPEKNRFRCDNSRCIWDGLHCDGHNHCGDNSDEPPGCAKTVWGVLVIVLGMASLCFFLPLFCYLAIWGPRRKVPVRIMGRTFFRSKESTAINNDEESVPILVGQPLQGSMPGETFTFYYGAASTNNPRC